jgi:hypothetical protein
MAWERELSVLASHLMYPRHDEGLFGHFRNAYVGRLCRQPGAKDGRSGDTASI